MIHFGDICKMDGAKIPVVDIITFGAPCQDISVAGKRKGMLNESRGDSETTRSGLFFEAVRVIKEMRENDRRTGRSGFMVRPRFAVYENVPGAFSSNKGKDFQAVLTEIVKIAEPDAPNVPLPDKGKWSHSGCLYDELGRWSVAWRLHDAQFWGVPQRRKRIALVADFGGLAAPEILFEREGLSGDSEPGSEEGQGAAAGAEGGAGSTSGVVKEMSAGFCRGQSARTRGIGYQIEQAPTIPNGDVPLVMETAGAVESGLGGTVSPLTAAFMGGQGSKAGGLGYQEEVSPSLKSVPSGGNTVPDVIHTCVAFKQGGYDSTGIGVDLYNQSTTGGVSKSLNSAATDSDYIPCVMKCFQNTGQGWWNQSNVGATLRTPCGGDSVKANLVTSLNSIVRRLTPLECERLQGYPSKKMVDVSQMTKDEYIAWNLAEGNIIADQERGKVYGTRGPGGCPYKEPKELKGSDVNGYKVVSIRNGATKLQCRVHRIIWISAHGIIPDVYVIDHINNDKMDNRLENLQLLTPEQNSKKAQADGLYKSGLDNKATKLDPDLKDEIAFLYEYSDLTMRNLAELYGVSKSRIAQIVHEVGWTGIGEWTDSKGKKHKPADSPRYKALGNSIALPFWAWMARRICAQYERPMTMGSLFDGIGGFPLVFERAGAKAVWASEIEEFCVAVTKKHFPEEVSEDG